MAESSPSASAAVASDAILTLRSLFPSLGVKRARELLNGVGGDIERAADLYLTRKHRDENVDESDNNGESGDEAEGADADDGSHNDSVEKRNGSSKNPRVKASNRSGSAERKRRAAAIKGADEQKGESNAADESMRDVKSSASEVSSPVRRGELSASSSFLAKRSTPTRTNHHHASSSAASPSPSKRQRKDAAATDPLQRSIAALFAGQSGHTARRANADRPSPPKQARTEKSIVTLGDQDDADRNGGGEEESNPAVFVNTGSASPSSATPTAAAALAGPTPPTHLLVGDATSSTTTSNPLSPCFRPGEAVPFIFLSRIFHLIEYETGRLKIINWLTYLFWQVLAFTPTDLAPVLFLSTDQLAPPYENHQLGVGGALLSKLVRELASISRDALYKEYSKYGDLGIIAALHQKRQTHIIQPKPLTVRNVFNTFHSLGTSDTLQKSKVKTATKAGRTRDGKEAMLRKLFGAARDHEITYLIRIAEGNLRIGAVTTTVLTALAKAFVLHHLFTDGLAPALHHTACTFERVVKASEAVRGFKPQLAAAFQLPPPSSEPLPPTIIAQRLPALLAHATARMRRAYAEHPSFHDIIPVLMRSSTAIYDLHRFIQITAGVPVKNQLGRPLNSIYAALKLFRGQSITVEVKYDGLRAQIHRLSDGSYRVFSRHLMNQKDRWDDLTPHIDAARNNLTECQSFILDAEIIAIRHTKPNKQHDAADTTDQSQTADQSNGASPAASPSFRILPFQQIATRRRKGSGIGSVGSSRVEVSCMVYVFDMMSLNGESLLLRPFSERRALLYSTFHEIPAAFQFVEHVDIDAATTASVPMEEIDEALEDQQTTPKKTQKQHNEQAKEEKGKKRAKQSKKKRLDEYERDGGDGEEDVSEVDEISDDDETAESQVIETNAAAASAAFSPSAFSSFPTTLQDDADMMDVETAVEIRQRAEAQKKANVGADLSPSAALSPYTSAAVASNRTAASSSSSSSLSPSPSPSSVDDPVGAASIIESFLVGTAIPRGEGVMVKSLGPLSTYEPDVRTDNWVKLKKDYISRFGIADSIDVAIIGAWWGNGRKAGWMSPFLAAVYNSETAEFESFAKIMSGFTDAQYRRLTDRCMEFIIPSGRKDYRVHPSLHPTMWFDAKLVFEIRGADLTISPTHSAAIGLVHENKGISLRFPRCIRIRDDKSVDQCTTSEQIADMYRSQMLK